MGPLSTMAMSTLLRARHRQQRHPLLFADLDAGTPQARTRVVGVFVCGETGDNVIELRRAGA
jgi:hypothetical protein